MSSPLTVQSVIGKKRDNKTLTKEEIDYFIQEVVSGGAQDSQIGAMLMAIYIRGMLSGETAYLTKAMVDSGDVLTWDKSWTLVDKHSTGGVGDKVSLPLAPSLAVLGFKVPMVSGRGLDFTGGTLDKLESIPGFKVSCTVEELHSALETAGCFIAGATGSLAPADKVLYQIRDVTGTVSSTPLIVGSIISKKAAEGTQYLCMDIKVGVAAFYNNVEDAENLAGELIKVAAELGIKAMAVLSRMDNPIGTCVGNSLEVADSLLCMKGQGRPDLVELVTTIGGLILQMNNKVKTLDEGKKTVNEVLNNGSALECFQKMLVCQGVKEEDANELCNGDMWKVLPAVPASQVTVLKVTTKGYIHEIDALTIGYACWEMGAGRSTSDQPIDYRVGVKLLKFVGDSVQVDDPWIEVHHATTVLSSEMQTKIESALKIDSKAVTPLGQVIKVVQ